MAKASTSWGSRADSSSRTTASWLRKIPADAGARARRGERCREQAETADRRPKEPSTDSAAYLGTRRPILCHWARNVIALHCPCNSSLLATFACCALRSLNGFTCVCHSHYLTLSRFMATRKAVPLTVPARRRGAISAFSRPLFIQDGRFTRWYGWFSLTAHQSRGGDWLQNQIMAHLENNSYITKRHRAAGSAAHLGRFVELQRVAREAVSEETPDSYRQHLLR